MTDLIPTRIHASTTAPILRLLAARDAYIADRPELAARYRRAQELVESTDDDVMYAALREISEVLHEATEAARTTLDNSPTSSDAADNSPQPKL
jgi:propanediol dehydratase small subunit